MAKYQLTYTEMDGFRKQISFVPDKPYDSHVLTNEITHVWEFERNNHEEAKKHAKKILKSERLYKRCKWTTVDVELVEILDFTVK